ncbi:MAG: hypothetical protein IT350_07985 [Deltaproteobacteria bacterium]|nr:hypothetical protein [Deltaproteobacteria bacterium]
MSFAKRWLLFGLVVALIACAPACGDDDDDDSSGDDDDDDDDENAYEVCDETSTIMGGSDAVSALVGVSADDVLDVTGGGFTVTATWSDDTSLLTQSPLGGETQLTVTFDHEGGEVREVESVPNDDGGGPEIAMDCLHRLEIDIALGVETDDGAFAESIPATLVQSLASGGSGLATPSVATDFDPYALAGDFEIVSVEGAVPDAVTAMFQSTAADPIAGDVQIFVQQTSGSGDDGTVSQSSHIALEWGIGDSD